MKKEIKNTEKKVYLVIEYKEKFTNKEKSIIVKGESLAAIDAQTENFETKERLAALYFDWANAFVEGPSKNLRDMYIISEESVLGNLLSSQISSSMTIIDLSFYNQEIIDENGKTTTMSMYEYGKALTPKKSIKLMENRTEEFSNKKYYIDRTPIIQMPKRVKRI